MVEIIAYGIFYTTLLHDGYLIHLQRLLKSGIHRTEKDGGTQDGVTATQRLETANAMSSLG
jgi:hypothetical protein